MNLAPTLEAELRAGTPVILQRAGPTEDAEAWREAWIAALGVSATLHNDPFRAEGPAVVDLRGHRSFGDWDPRRGVLERRTEPLLILLDVQAARTLLRDAPQTASWAGGVRLPDPPTVVPARTEQEVALGREMLARALREQDPEWVKANVGVAVGIDLAAARLFLRSGDRLPLQQAQDELDHGIVYVGRVREP